MGLPSGWWRPLASYGGVLVVAIVVIGARTPHTVVPAALGSIPLILFIVSRSMFPVQSFLRGLRDAGGDVVLVHDELTWLGERKTRARTAAGEWRVECFAGNHVRLSARGPGMPRMRVVKGDPRAAAREAAGDGRIPPARLAEVFA